MLLLMPAIFFRSLLYVCVGGWVSVGVGVGVCVSECECSCRCPLCSSDLCFMCVWVCMCVGVCACQSVNALADAHYVLQIFALCV